MRVRQSLNAYVHFDAAPPVTRAFRRNSRLFATSTALGMDRKCRREGLQSNPCVLSHANGGELRLRAVPPNLPWSSSWHDASSWLGESVYKTGARTPVWCSFRDAEQLARVFEPPTIPSPWPQPRCRNPLLAPACDRVRASQCREIPSTSSLFRVRWLLRSWTLAESACARTS